jgi:hypothetical protein
MAMAPDVDVETDPCFLVLRLAFMYFYIVLCAVCVCGLWAGGLMADGILRDYHMYARIDIVKNKKQEDRGICRLQTADCRL